MASSTLEGLLSHYQSFVIAQSVPTTYQAGVRALQQFCTHYAISAFPASPLTLYSFAATWLAEYHIRS